MARLLKDLQINDVSSVDRGAGRGVKVLLMKRDDDLPAEVESYLKREFSSDQRKEMADKGTALPDGSFPISNTGDLKNAIQAIGRAKNPAKAKAHIKARAKALGASDKIPDSWSKRDDNVIDMTNLLRKGAVDFDTSLENNETAEEARDLMCEIGECIGALGCAVNSILWDEGVVDKAAAIDESFTQFKDYIAGLTPATLEKSAMNAEVKKQIDDAVAAALKDVTDKVTKSETENAALKDQVAFLSLSPAAQEFCKAMSPEDKKKFAAKDKKGQDDEMDDAKKRAAQTIDPDIKKRLDRADENEKILKALQEKDEVATFAKRAAEIGLPEADGELLRKAHKGDAVALKAVEDKIGEMHKAMTEAQKTGKIFKEFGNVNEKGGSSALDQLNAKAEELRKSEGGKDLSQAQAFAKVYGDPSNAELAQRERQERNKQMGVAA